jgi:choline dehydrogenase-like flavoprotein
VTINSSDPFAKPVVDLGLLNSEFDMYTMKEAIKAARRFVAAPAWKGYVLEPYGAFANATDDASLERYIRDHADSVYHPCGTVAMSPKNAAWGVLDSHLRVKSSFGLRVVDGSIFVSSWPRICVCDWL